jgi:hypothetical protein
VWQHKTRARPITQFAAKLASMSPENGKPLLGCHGGLTSWLCFLFLLEARIYIFYSRLEKKLAILTIHQFPLVIFHVNRKNLICSNIFVLGGNKKVQCDETGPEENSVSVFSIARLFYIWFYHHDWAGFYQVQAYPVSLKHRQIKIKHFFAKDR